MKNKQPVSFVIAIVLMWTLPAMSTDIYLPSMPVMASFFNTTISQIQHKIQGNIFLPPYYRFFFLKERLPIRDVEKITNAEHNGRKIRCSTPSSQRITPCPPGVRQIRNSSRIRNVPPMNLIFWGCHRTVGSVSLHIHPSNNSGSAKRS